jgi:hypothetical protein
LNAVGDVGARFGADHEHGAQTPALDDLDQVFHYARIVQRRGDQSGGTQNVIRAPLCERGFAQPFHSLAGSFAVELQ